MWLACHNDLTSGTSDATRVDLARMGVIEVQDALTVTSPVDVKLTDLALGLGSIWYVNTAGNAVAQVNEQTLQKQARRERRACARRRRRRVRLGLDRELRRRHRLPGLSRPFGSGRHAEDDPRR